MVLTPREASAPLVSAPGHGFRELARPSGRVVPTATAFDIDLILDGHTCALVWVEWALPPPKEPKSG